MTNPKLLTAEIAGATSAQSVLDVLEKELDNPIFNEFHLGASFIGLARYRSTFTPNVQGNPTITALADKVRRFVKSGGLSARGCANILWSVATLRNSAPQLKGLLPILVSNAEFVVLDMDEQQISNVLWAFATLRMDKAELGGLVPLLVERIVDRADTFKPQAVSNVIWATATLRHQVPELQEVLPVLAEILAERLPDFKPQALSNIIWATANFEDPAPELLECLPGLAKQVMKKSEMLNPQGFSNIIWATAILKERAPPELLECLPVLSRRATAKMNRLNGLDLSSLCFGLVTCGLDSKIFSAKAARHMVALMPRLENKDLALTIASVLWAFARWQVHDKDLLHAASLFIPKAMQYFTGWSVCAVLWSYQELDLQDKYREVKSMLEQEITRRGLSDTDVRRSSLGVHSWQ